MILDMTMAGPDGQYYVVLDVSQLEVGLIQIVPEVFSDMHSIFAMQYRTRLFEYTV